MSAPRSPATTPDAGLALDARVRVLTGAYRGSLGRVVQLTAAEPGVPASALVEFLSAFRVRYTPAELALIEPA